MAEPGLPATGRSRWLVVMAKEPRAGAVKTRLARDIGTVAATGFYRHSLAALTARLARDPRWRTIIAVTPDGACCSPAWPARVARLAQGPGDLGARMQRVFDSLPPGPAVIIGADIPDIRADHIANAFALLGSHDAVFGPAKDGGYWLVGLRRFPKIRAIFSDVRWSSAHALDDTLANLAGSSVAVVEQLQDVDDGKSHRRLKHAGGRVIKPRS
jgi:rSAM/selenodomain-associated transferase 1